MIHDLITAILVAFAAVTASEVLAKDLAVPLAEMDEGDVRHAADPNAQALTKVRLFWPAVPDSMPFRTPIPVRRTLFFNF